MSNKEEIQEFKQQINSLRSVIEALVKSMENIESQMNKDYPTAAATDKSSIVGSKESSSKK
jgi:prefoldin subunit 5